MLKNLKRITSLLLLLFAVVEVQGQFDFSDNATNYGGSWTDGSNNGTGYNAWSITTGGAASGTFIGDPSSGGMGTTGIGSTAFGLFGHSGQFVDAIRYFGAGGTNVPMQIGDEFSFYWAMNWDAGGGAKGFNLRADGTTIFNVNNGSGDNIATTNGTAFTVFGTNPMLVTITRLNWTQYSFSMTARDGGATYNTTINSTANINNIAIYCGGQPDSNSNRNIFFNEFDFVKAAPYETNFDLIDTRVLAGSSNLTKTGTGNLTLNAANTFTGNTIINENFLIIGADNRLGAAPGSPTANKVQIGDGTLGINTTLAINSNRGITLTNPNSTIDIFGSQTVTYNGIIIGSGTHAFTKAGPGRLILGGGNTYTGNTTISAGILEIDDNNALGSISSPTTVLSGAMLEIDGADQLSEPLFLNGSGQGTSGALRKVNSGTDQFSGAIGFQSDSRIHIDEGNFDYLGPMNLNGFTFYLGGDGNFNFESSSSLLGATKTSFDGAIFKDGTGLLEFRPNTSINGNLFFLNGEVRQFTGDYPSSGLLVLDGDVIYRSDGNTDRDIAKPTRIDGNITIGHSTGGAGQMDFQSTVDFSTGNHILTMTNDNFISGQMTNGSFTKTGTGSLTIQGATANSLSDGSIVNAGTLILAKDAGLQATSGLSIQSGAIVRTDNDNQWGTTAPPFIQIFGGTLNVNSTDQRLALAGDAAASVTLGTGTITIDGTGTDTFAGVISGAGGLTKEGSGKEILTGTNTYTGSTTITEGTLELGVSEVLSNSSAIVLNGGTLRSTGTTTETMGTLELAESSTIDLGGTGEELTFANSSAINWNSEAELTILGWTGSAETAGAGSRIFLGSQSDLTDDQLLQIQFQGYDFGALILPITFELVPAIQTIKRFDNFNRGQDDVVGLPSGGNPGSWIEAEGGCGNAFLVEVSSDNQLQLNGGNGCAGDTDTKQASFNVSGEYSTIFRDADSELEWNFNLRQSETNPSLNNRTAFILGSTESDFSSSTAEGYAVVIGENSPENDDLRLIRFNAGIPNIASLSSNVILTSPQSTSNNYFSVRVTFDPCSSEWTMTVRDDGSTDFRDPASINTVGGTAIDFTNSDLDLPFIGAYRRHSPTGTRTAFFDNIYIPASPSASNSYVWNLPGNGDYQIPNNWTPVRTCGRGGDILTFESGGSHIITNIPNEIIGQLIVQNNTSITLRDELGGGPAPNRLTISGRSVGTDLIVANGSSLIYDTGNNLTDNYLEIALASGATGEISGNLDFTKSFSGTNPKHKLLGEDFESIRITSTGRIRAFDLFATSNEHPFGRLLPNETVIFESGSVYESYSGNNPFGSDAPDSKVRFESGSTYRHIGNHLFSIGGRQYANFDYQNNSTPQSLNSGTTAGWNMEDFRILQGSLTLDGGFIDIPFNINVSGDFEVASGATLNYTPVVAVPPAQSIFNFNGSSPQTITGAGNLNFNDRVAIEVNNTYNSGGYALEIQRDLDLFADFIVNDGIVEGFGGATISFSGADAILFVGDNINGTNVGAGRNLNLDIASGRTTVQGAGGNCDFLNINVRSNAVLDIERGIEAISGAFTVEANADLEINAGGFIDNTNADSRAPIYALGADLIYNTGSSFGRGFEWVQNTTTQGEAGFPDRIIIQNGTILFSDASAQLACGGDILIGSSQGIGTFNINTTSSVQIGSSLRLGVDGNLGNLTLSGGAGGDLFVAGDFTKNGNDAVGILNQNQREIVMNGAAAQSISGVNTFTLLGIDNSAATVSIDEDLLITNRLRLSGGVFSLGSFDATMEDNSEIQRTSAGATMSKEPLVVSTDRYNISYLDVLTTNNEWSSDEEAVRDVYLNENITIGGNRALNRDLNMDGANIDLNGNSLRLKGRNTSAGLFAGDINISQSGERQINGTGILLVNGEGGTDPSALTKRVVSSNGATLRISADSELQIGDGGFDFGTGNPTTMDGRLTIFGGGYVEDHSCFYSINSVLSFQNGFDYQVNSTDLTWAQGAVGQAGVPYNVESVGASTTDLTLNAPRTLANNLTIENALFTLTASSGTFRIGGNWTRTGGDFVHNDQEVIFNGISPQTQTISTTGGETFFELSFENDGTKTLSQDVTVLNNLNIRNGGNLDGGTATAFINGTWNNEIGESAFNENTGTVVFQGSSTQDINCIAGERFHNLTVNNTAILAIDLEDETRVSGTLTMTDGILRTQGNSFILTNGSSMSGGSVDSYVDGAITKIGVTNGVEITFPVGDYRDDLAPVRNVYQPAGLIPTGTSATAEFDVEYFQDNYTPGFTNPNNPPPTDASIESASTCNYWMIDRIVGSVDAQIRLYWNAQSCLTVDESSDITVARWTGANPSIGAWDNQAETGVTPATGPAASGNVVSGTVTAFSPFALASTDPSLNILPITLLSFHAKAEDRTVLTSWVTASEINNDFFTVERSKDGSTWEKVGTVDGAGNSNTELTYAFVDDDPYSGVSYYRLRQTDFDGTTTVSQIRAVEILQGSSFGLNKVYRGQDGLNLVYRSTAPYVVVEIYDLLGKRIHGELIENYGNGFATIHPDLARGAYVLRLSHGSEMDAEKFVW
jgi:autotransporter-associated beta strand protein